MTGVTMPSWAAVALLVVAVAATFTLLLTLFSLREHTRETRVLDQHIMDIENVLIRQSIGKREDFPPRSPERESP